ncbi:MAG: leucine--tRNA ligase [SAR202 cluster bacterium]|nr:leucine--tRNA ligase [SAR202 cluster bacterium]
MTQQTQRLAELRWDPKALDAKWQARWDHDGLYRWQPDARGEKWYELTMYPYPSGALHIGHWYAYAPYDAHVRFQRMSGKNVLAPFGFDAFGLPAENAAIRRGIHPLAWTTGNIENMRRQVRSMGCAFAWDQEVVCCLPEYYGWNQWLFLQLFKHGLAYKANAPAVWCPSCQTVLANEQVIAGRCERCDTPITRREMSQWFLRTTRYADQLLDFSGLVDWPEKILIMQRNWIGRSPGVEVGFDISHLGLDEKELRVFTTRVDTLYGVTFMVLAPEHPLVSKLTAPDRRAAVEAYVEEARRKSDIERLATDREKTGEALGTFCINPVNGERVHLFTADYAVAWYATGAVMGVPAHDQRDFDFAKQYGLPVRVVISPPGWNGEALTQAYVDEGTHVNSGPFNGMPNTRGIEAIADHVERLARGKRVITYRMRDWLISRQRYWGTPIPIIECGHCGTLPVPEDQLPVLLPEDVEFKPTGDSPLARHEQFMRVTCPQCGRDARRESDTMDTFVDSSWYFLRYLSPHDDKQPWSPELARKWMPVDQYTGGAEHAVMHLLYARFFTKALRDIGLVNFGEPFLRLFNQGIILGEDHEKMSKSRGNVVAPDDYVGELGADVVRCYLMFLGPWDRGGPWSTAGINGAARWLNRVWDLMARNTPDLDTPAVERGEGNGASVEGGRALRAAVHRTVKKVTADVAGFQFNTAIAALMELSNAMQDAWEARQTSAAAWWEAQDKFLLMLAPFAPHLAEEMWEKTGRAYSVHRQPWPAWDESLIVAETITLVVQVNGRVRDRLTVPASMTEADAKQAALASANVQKFLAGQQVRNIVYVPGRLVNVVVG